MKVGLAYAAKNAKEPSIWEKFDLSIKTIAGLIVVLMAAIIPLYYKSKKYRTIQQILNTIVLGFWSGSFLSYTLFLSYASNGINWYVSIIPIIMLITAFIYPLFGKKNYYCNYICPCGSLQELVGKTSKKKWKIKSKYIVMLNRFRKILWATVTVLMLCGIGFEWMDYEIFSAFIFTSASVVVLILAAIFILLSYFVPRPYCRFVCPTGTFIKMA
jgi:polyferredoxin